MISSQHEEKSLGYSTILHCGYIRELREVNSLHWVEGQSSKRKKQWLFWYTLKYYAILIELCCNYNGHSNCYLQSLNCFNV